MQFLFFWFSLAYAINLTPISATIQLDSPNAILYITCDNQPQDITTYDETRILVRVNGGATEKYLYHGSEWSIDSSSNQIVIVLSQANTYAIQGLDLWNNAEIKFCSNWLTGGDYGVPISAITLNVLALPSSMPSRPPSSGAPTTGPPSEREPIAPSLRPTESPLPVPEVDLPEPTDDPVEGSANYINGILWIVAIQMIIFLT